eukprot:6459808-Amphidinium_carterae.2
MRDIALALCAGQCMATDVAKHAHGRGSQHPDTSTPAPAFELNPPDLVSWVTETATFVKQLTLEQQVALFLVVYFSLAAVATCRKLYNRRRFVARCRREGLIVNSTALSAICRTLLSFVSMGVISLLTYEQRVQQGRFRTFDVVAKRAARERAAKLRSGASATEPSQLLSTASGTGGASLTDPLLEKASEAGAMPNGWLNTTFRNAAAQVQKLDRSGSTSAKSVMTTTAKLGTEGSGDALASWLTSKPLASAGHCRLGRHHVSWATHKGGTNAAR